MLKYISNVHNGLECTHLYAKHNAKVMHKQFGSMTLIDTREQQTNSSYMNNKNISQQATTLDMANICNPVNSLLFW